MKKYLFIPFIFLSIVSGCNKKDIQGGLMPDGLIALSFDDAYIDNWHSSLSLLDSLNIKATFYISCYHSLTNTQKSKLHTIEATGHEIAYHTTNHSDLVKLYSNNSMKYVLESEIKPDLDLMRKDGFNPENFAYPYGQHDTYLDRQLMVYFKSLRAVCNSKNYDKSLVKQASGSQVFHAPSIDTKMIFLG